MQAQCLPSVARAALLALVSVAIQLSSSSAYAQGFAANASDYELAKKNLAACFDESQPPSSRIDTCTFAIERVDRALLGLPALAKTYLARGQAFQQSGDDQAALKDFSVAAKQDRRSDLPWIALGNFYTAKSDHPNALEAYDHALQINGKDPVAYDDRGSELEVLGRRDDAIADFTQAIVLDPHDTVAYFNRATLYLASDRPEPAIADLTEVIRAEPRHARAYYDRGKAYERGGELDKALEDYRSTVRIDPSFAPAYAAIGGLLEAKDPDAALSEFTAAIQRDPRSPALRTRALLYLSLGRTEQALTDFDQVIANDHSDGIAYADRGVAKAKRGDLEGAIGDYSRSIELAPTVAAYVNRGNAYAYQHHAGEALADFDSALQIDAQNVLARLGRANANYASKHLAESLEDYTRVIDLDPSNAVAYFKRGNIHFDQRAFAAAFADYSASLKLDPHQPVVLFDRSLAAEHIGRAEDAEKDRRQALKLDATVATTAASAALQSTFVAPQMASAPPAPITFAPARAEPAAPTSAPTEAPAAEVTIRARRVVVNGEERFCRIEPVLGSRILKQEVCLTQAQLQAEQQGAQQLFQDIQRRSGTGQQKPMISGGMAP